MKVLILAVLFVSCAIANPVSCNAVALSDEGSQRQQCLQCPSIVLYAQESSGKPIDLTSELIRYYFQGFDTNATSAGSPATFHASNCNSGNGGLYVWMTTAFKPAGQVSKRFII